jgi:hypothetical protein
MNEELRSLITGLRRLEQGRTEAFSVSFPTGLTTRHVAIPVANDICRQATRHLLVSLIEHAQAEAASLYPVPE